MISNDTKKTGIKAKIKLHNYRYPHKISDHKSGDFAIVNCDVIQLIDGFIPEEANLANKSNYAADLRGYPIITIIGKLPKLIANSEYIFEGDMTVDREFGPQYKILSMRLNFDMSNIEDQKKFFRYFMTDNQIENLFQSYENPIELLEQKNIGELTKAKGIGRVTAAKMCLRYEECKDKSRAYVILSDLGLTKNAIDRIVAHYKSADLAVEAIENNPYVLIREVRGYGWKKADAIALKKGFTRDCKERVIAYTQYYLDEQAESNGNSWVSIQDLLTNVSNECSPVTKENLVEWIKALITDDEGFDRFYAQYLDDKYTEIPSMLYYDRKQKKVGLFKLRLLEKEISRHFKRLKTSPAHFHYDKSMCEQIIKEVEEEQGFEYTDEQLQAIYDILNNNVCILSGFGGTGKTSAIKAATRIFEYYNQDVDLCALSGKASSLLNELTGSSGKTIHRLLAYNSEREKFSYNEKIHLPSDVVILDEASMVGGELFLSLIQAIQGGSKFIMIGDFHQLEAIGFCNILKDCMASGYIKTIVLNKIHRQAAKSGIITQSIKVANGESLVKSNCIGSDVRGELKDFKITCSMDPGLVQLNVINEFKDIYFNHHVPLNDIQVIVPMKTRGDNSCRVLNNIIQSIVNPETYFNEVYLDFMENGMKYTICFKPKDRIIVTHNNYHVFGMDGKEKQIFNGNTGVIKDISDDIMVITLREQGDVVIPRDKWYDIQLGYCITTHKSQGSTIPYVIMVLDTSSYALFSKELVYTGITRASHYCCLITQPKAINVATKISRVKTKQTWLIDDLRNIYIDEVEKKYKK